MPWRKGNRLQTIREQDAQPAVRALYDDIRQSLGLAHVNVIYQVYAYYPTFLEAHWRAMKPVVSTRLFFELAQRISADAYTRMHNYFEIPDLCARTADLRFSSGAQQELAEVIELFQYSNPLLLLLVSAQMQSFDGPTGNPDAPRDPAIHPVFVNKPCFVEEESAPPPTRKIFEEMKRIYGMPVINSDFRALARWPDFLRTYWETLKPVNASPLFQQSAYALRENALNLARELPGPFEVTVAQLTESGMTDDQMASLVRITELFVGGLSSLVLNMAIAKIGMEGGNLHKKQPAEQQPSPTQAA